MMTERGHTILEQSDEKFIRWRTVRNTNARAGDFEILRKRGLWSMIVDLCAGVLVLIGVAVLANVAVRYFFLRFFT